MNHGNAFFRCSDVTDVVSVGPASDPTKFRMDPMADAAWTVVFSLMIISAIAGNLVVFWIVLGMTASTYLLTK